MSQIPLAPRGKPQLSRRASWLVFVAVGAMIMLMHLGLQVAIRVRFGSAAGQTYLVWHVLALAGIALAWLALYWRRYLLAYCLVLLVLFDTAFGIGSSVLARYGLFESYLPRRIDYVTRFTYHPLLQGVPKPSFSKEWILPNGTTIQVEHNEHGMRRSKPVDPDKPTIVVLGGSTTYDIGVSNSETWVDKIEDYYPPFQFLNFGVPGYSSVEHLIQTAFYFPARPAPFCAVYYIGWNDARNSHVPTLDPAYADFHMRAQLRNLGTTKQAHLGSPLLTFVASALRSFLLPDMRIPQFPPDLVKSNIDERLIGFFEQHVRQIVQLNAPRNIKTVFVGQLLNYAAFTAEGSSTWSPLIADRAMRSTIAAFNGILKKVGSETGATYLEVDESKFGPDDFVDNGHFSVRGADKFARAVGPSIVGACRR